MKSVLIVVFLLIALLVAGVIYTNQNSDGKGGGEETKKISDELWNLSASDEKKKTIADNEASVIQLLKQYVEAQKSYKEKNGSYASSLFMLNVPAGMKEAQPDNTGSKGFHGYTYIHVPKNGSSDMNYERDFILCAAPHVYRSTGMHTFAIGPRGIVLYKDNNGRHAYNATDFADRTWKTK